ncbi:MAG: hypothetical protein IPK18_08475 [Sphingobacteriales bacterium]|nr:MAG: hypothetical protein IPK18_08475 [Sphingobacteriales bacterium]
MKGRKIGTIKTGGRAKGTPNKTTKEIKECIVNLVSNNIDLLIDDIKQLEPKDRVYLLDKLLKYVLPQNIEINNTENDIKKFVIRIKKNQPKED